jgi:hypothetical protein
MNLLFIARVQQTTPILDISERFFVRLWPGYSSTTILPAVLNSQFFNAYSLKKPDKLSDLHPPPSHWTYEIFFIKNRSPIFSNVSTH